MTLGISQAITRHRRLPLHNSLILLCRCIQIPAKFNVLLY